MSQSDVAIQSPTSHVYMQIDWQPGVDQWRRGQAEMLSIIICR